jgi:3-oxoacyl-[acyl-carrier-protein] synthase-3
MKKKFNNVSISAIDYYLPETIVSSEDLEKELSPLYERLKLPEGRLELMTGIKERRYWPQGTRPSDLSTKAAQNLFEKNNVNPQQIDLLIHASVCRDFLEPATASVIHANLNLKKEAMTFDLSNACLGILNGMIMAAEMIDSGAVETAIVVGGENSAPLIFETIKFLNTSDINRKELKKYFANLTIGSGACAVLLKKGDHLLKLKSFSALTDGSSNKLCQGDGNPNSLMMQTDSEELLKAGIQLAKENWELLAVRPSWSIGHQVGTAHEKLMRETLGITETKTFTTYQTLGNTGTVALPITLAKFLESEPELSGIGTLLGIGSGLTTIFIEVEK